MNHDEEFLAADAARVEAFAHLRAMLRDGTEARAGASLDEWMMRHLAAAEGQVRILAAISERDSAVEELNAVRAARAERDAAEARFLRAVLAAHDAGASYRTIAEYAGLSHQRIAQIVTEHRAATREG